VRKIKHPAGFLLDAHFRCLEVNSARLNLNHSPGTKPHFFSKLPQVSVAHLRDVLASTAIFIQFVE
jgi:hypothetical protein